MVLFKGREGTVGGIEARGFVSVTIWGKNLLGGPRACRAPAAPMVEVLAILFGAAVFGGFGVLLCWAAVSTMQAAANEEAGSLHADGVVVEIRTSRDSGLVDGNPKSPVVRFSTASGEEVEFESSVGSDPSSYSVGQRVPVFYHADDPARADIVRAHVSFCILMLLFGSAFFGIGILGLGVAGLRVWRAIW